MTPEELLIPRVKIIADWFGNRMPVGKILVLDQVTKNGRHWHCYTPDEPLHLEEGNIPHPHLLQPLEWWRDRKMEDMPKFLKWIDVAGVFPVTQWLGVNYKDVPICKLGISSVTVAASNYLPASEEEYIAQQNSKTLL